MGAFRNIFRLTRPLNLFIVMGTMFAIRYFVMGKIMQNSSIGMKFQISIAQFILLIISVLAITAAGNIINDYFDQKVDRINKPEKVIIGKTVKRRVAIVLHQGLNVIAILCTIVICAQTSLWWPLIIPIIIISLLWWYSPVLKKRVFIGNLTVALCSAAVPLWAAIFEIHGLQTAYTDLLVDAPSFFNQLWTWISIICAFALILTLIREVIKDMEDLPGDIEGEYHTIPIVFGIDKTKYYIYTLLTIFILSVAACATQFSGLIEISLICLLLIIPSLYTFFILHKATSPPDFRKCGNVMKLIAAGGVFLLVIL